MKPYSKSLEHDAQGGPTVPRVPFEKALSKFESGHFSKSLIILKGIFSKPLGKPDEFSISARQAAILFAWNLHQLRQYEECVDWLKEAKEKNLIPMFDPEAQLIELWIVCLKGHYTPVISKCDEFINDNKDRIDSLLAEYFYLRGFSQSFMGEIDCALDDCETSYFIFKLTEKPRAQALVSNKLGWCFLQICNFMESLKWFQTSLKNHTKFNSSRGIGINRLNIGIVLYKLGRLSESHSEIILARNMFRDQQSYDQLCLAEIALGNVCRIERDFEDARKFLTKAYTFATENRFPRNESLALEFLGDVYRDEGKPEEALRFYRRSLAIAMEIAPEGDLVMELWRREGECLELMDEVTKAMPILAKARTLAKKLQDRFEEGVILRCLGVCATRLQDWDAARNYLEESVKMLREIDARFELAISYLELSRTLSEMADDPGQPISPPLLLEDAWQNALAAQHLFLDFGIEYWLDAIKLTISRIAKQRITDARYRQLEEKEKLFDVPENFIVAVSTAMRSVLELCDAYARFEEAVLITGETGTGKELIAQRLHQKSSRKSRPLVAINVAAVPESMFEREFFGHRKGAFSGADQDRKGLAAEADSGTLFLDEIADLPLDLQPKLLRLLQEGTYLALGDPQEKRANVRLIAATNANLAQLVKEGKFRDDLFYRLRVLEIAIPPLRDRPEDVLPLLEHFLSKSVGRRAYVGEFFDDTSIEAMKRYRWRGNVREIAMVARRAHISMQAEGRIRIEIGLSPDTLLLTGPTNVARAAVGVTVEDDLRRSRILVALEEAEGNRTEAARQLGIARPTLYRWMKRLGIDPSDSG